MNKKRIEQLREIINTMICSDDYDHNKLVEVSQELDKLILQEVKKNVYVMDVFGKGYIGEFDAIIDRIQRFEKMYDSMRIVDPINKKVLQLDKGGVIHQVNTECYNLWENDAVCKNCISMRAYNEDDVVIKIEYCKSKAYMVVAVPVFVYDKKLVVELFKDVTNCMYMQNEE